MLIETSELPKRKKKLNEERKEREKRLMME